MPDASSVDERAALGRCLFTLLFLVSGADGRSTDPEARAIGAALRGLDERFGEGHGARVDLSPASVHRARQASEGLGFHLQGDEVLRARAALDAMPAPRRAAYEAYFVEACLAVAEASADFLGLGARINADERLLVLDITQRLGLRVSDPAARDKLGL